MEQSDRSLFKILFWTVFLHLHHSIFTILIQILHVKRILKKLAQNIHLYVKYTRNKKWTLMSAGTVASLMVYGIGLGFLMWCVAS